MTKRTLVPGVEAEPTQGVPTETPFFDAAKKFTDSFAAWVGVDPEEAARVANAAARRERVTRRLLALACFFAWYAVLFVGAIGLTMTGPGATFFNMLIGIPACVLAVFLTYYTRKRWT